VDIMKASYTNTIGAVELKAVWTDVDFDPSLDACYYNVFGAKFTRSLFQLDPGSWQGPIESGFGWHLVWVESMTPARVPAFEEVEPEVKAE
jgi:hypothetical protein